MDQCHLKICAQKDSTNELDKSLLKIAEKILQWLIVTKMHGNKVLSRSSHPTCYCCFLDYVSLFRCGMHVCCHLCRELEKMKQEFVEKEHDLERVVSSLSKTTHVGQWVTIPFNSLYMVSNISKRRINNWCIALTTWRE